MTDIDWGELSIPEIQAATRALLNAHAALLEKAEVTTSPVAQNGIFDAIKVVFDEAETGMAEFRKHVCSFCGARDDRPDDNLHCVGDNQPHPWHTCGDIFTHVPGSDCPARIGVLA